MYELLVLFYWWEHLQTCWFVDWLWIDVRKPPNFLFHVIHFTKSLILDLTLQLFHEYLNVNSSKVEKSTSSTVQWSIPEDTSPANKSDIYILPDNSLLSSWSSRRGRQDFSALIDFIQHLIYEYLRIILGKTYKSINKMTWAKPYPEGA